MYFTDIGNEITAFGKTDNQAQLKGKALGRKIAERCPNYESLEAPDQASVKAELTAYLTLSYPAAEQRLLALKPKDLKDAEQVRRTNLSGTIRSTVSKLLRFAFPKDRGHAVKRSIEQYLIDTFKQIQKRCEATNRGEWSDNVKVAYEGTKEIMSKIK